VSAPPGPPRWLFQEEQPLALNIPLEPGIYAKVIFPRPMTEKRWSQFWCVLDTMKPGIVREPPAADDESIIPR
jgi:hypothetical protein